MNKKLLAMLMVLFSLNSFAGDGFSGTYVGLQFGYVEGTDKGVESWTPPTLNGWSQETKPSGGQLGIVGGFNKIFNNNILVGVEADLEHRIASDNTLQASGGVPDSCCPVETELKAAFSLRPRLGYLINGNQTLVFVTAGYASADIKRTFGSDGDTLTKSKRQNGWTAGFGVEHMVGSNLTAKIEYRYADLGSYTMSTAAIYGLSTVEYQDYNEQSVRLGLMYHF